MFSCFGLFLSLEACFLCIEVEIASKSSKATRSPGGKRKPSISTGMWCVCVCVCCRLFGIVVLFG